MRFIVFVLVVLLCSAVTHASELEQAYQKEYAYLVAEKKALEQRLQQLKKSQERQLNNASKEIEALQRSFLTNQNKTDRLNHRITEASRGVDHVENDNLVLETTLIQARGSLQRLEKEIAEDDNLAEQLAKALEIANNVTVSDGRVYAAQGRYYLPNGEAVDGQVLHVGRVAKYGVSPQGGGILAPAGSRQFKVWSGYTHFIAEQLAENHFPAQIDVFLFDNIEKGIDKQDEKNFEDDVRASGLVGKVIIGLGILGVLFVLLRILFLMRAGSNIQSMTRRVNRDIETKDIDHALEVCKENTSAGGNVIAATLVNLHKDRDSIKDIISETILHESGRIDRFNTVILVIAAISPLLGLLGTVTGMISTFDIITEFGTGDPKLLSSGISEALLTTKFGLVVAIPLLLIGNLLSGWGRKIKDDLEQAALNMINTHKA